MPLNEEYLNIEMLTISIKRGASVVFEDHEQEVLEIDCREMDLIPALSLDNRWKKELEYKEFDRLRLKTKYFTKEYNKKGALLSIEPFFVDIRFGLHEGNVKLEKEYVTKTGARVKIFKKIDSVGYIYHMEIPEMKLTFRQLIDFYEKVDEFKEKGFTEDELIKRWYLEYGILEHLLFDDKILEINVNPPAYKTSMRIVHADFDECTSNMYPSEDFLNYLATRLKIHSGRPINKAQPQLDSEIIIKNQKARVAAIINPFSVFGMGYSIRKHREYPWTLPLFMSNNTVNPWFSGLMSFAIAHGRSFLVAGPRGSGKTALLGSLLLEILPKYRMITIEDTQELPIESYKKMGYDILPLKVRSALLKEGLEMPFDTGLRTSLRLGDSCLIIGEIRSKEATVLYEAMRVGAMANVVAGTIHGDSPYGVYDRVVNDLGVPKGSFKVTDLIIIVNQIKTASGLHRKRRVLQVTEVLKDWEDRPKFQDLLVYNPKTDTLEATQDLLGGRSILLQTIMKVSQGYKDYNAVLQDIMLRGWGKKMHLEMASTDRGLLEGIHVAKTNIIFTKGFEEIEPLVSHEKEELFKRHYMSETKNYFDAVKNLHLEEQSIDKET